LIRGFFVAISFASLVAGIFFACIHPAAASLATGFFLGALGVFLWRPRLGLLSLPLFLPLLSFSPWTGWLIVEEFDLLVLAVVAAGYLRLQPDKSQLQQGRFFLFLVIVVFLVLHGANELAMQDVNWFSGYITPLNSLRVGKAFLWLVLLYPLVARFCEESSPYKAGADFFAACLLGSCWVVLAVLWERSFYPGLLDISTPYRTVALFWEMHQGGAALDAYLVLIAPLLVWAWRATHSLPARLVIGVFVVAFVYVCLTTFSRGVFGAIAGSMILLGALLASRRVGGAHAWQGFSRSGMLVFLLVVLEVALVLGGDSFMSKRLAATERDFGGRLQHWEQGIGLLKSPDEWLFGIGLGKLPSRLTQGEAGLALPGAFVTHAEDDRRTMLISGPDGAYEDQELGGLYALSQRVDLIPGQRYRFAMGVRSEQGAEVLVQVCAVHLLYPASCQRRHLNISPGGWRSSASSLSGRFFTVPFWQRAGRGVLSLSVLTPGAKIEVADLQLSAGGANLLRNAQFLEEGAGWFPAVRSYFLPWHIDNLYLEILIETGLVGLFVFLAIVGRVVWRLFLACRRGDILAPYLLSGIAGLMALGLVVSVFDMPRVATLFGLFLLLGWQSTVCERRG
jgi:hypothetical protein